MTRLSMVAALNLALRHTLHDDPRLILLGEDIGRHGGVFRVTDGLQKDFGDNRVLDTPLAESGIVGTAIGLALRGFRPVVEIQFDGFVYPAANQIISQLAKLRARAEGRLHLPLTIRIPYGGGIGAIEHHSESPEVYFAHTAGLRVVTPANPHDAYWMLRQAMASDDPVLFFEPKRRYWDKDEIDEAGTDLTLHQARIARPGEDLTLAAYGPMVRVCLDAASAAAPERSIEVLDLRSISPVDFDTLERSVAKTRRLIVTHEAPVRYGPGAELAAEIAERCFYQLHAPVLRVGAPHTPYPPARVEQHYLPDLDRILDAVDASFTH
jgi:2-oxoisovalerate dehydrogenase E1 component beta subunit